MSLHSFGMFIRKRPDGTLNLHTELDKTSLFGCNLALDA